MRHCWSWANLLLFTETRTILKCCSSDSILAKIPPVFYCFCLSFMKTKQTKNIKKVLESLMVVPWCDQFNGSRRFWFWPVTYPCSQTSPSLSLVYYALLCERSFPPIVCSSRSLCVHLCEHVFFFFSFTAPWHCESQGDNCEARRESAHHHVGLDVFVCVFLISH